MSPDVLETVYYPTLVLGTLEDEAVLGALVPRDLVSHLLQLVPSLWRLREAALLEKVLTVVKHPRVGEPRHTVDPVLVDEGIYRGLQELLLLGLGEAVGDVQDPAVRGELRRPDDVAAYDVYLRGPGLELGPQLVEELSRVGGHLP